MAAPRRYRVVQKVGTTFTELPNVLQLSVDFGRRALLDVFHPGQAVFTYRRIDSNTVIPALDTKIYIVDYLTGTTAQQIAELNPLLHVGRVKDAVVDWAIDDAGDTITVTVEGALGAFGRNITNHTFPHDNLADYLAAMETEFGVDIGLLNAGSDEEIHTVDWTDSCANLLRLIATTTYGRLLEGDDKVWLLAKNYGNVPGISFSDNPTISTQQKYDSIRYESLADNYYTKIQVNYPGSSVTVGTGDRALILETLARNATNATAMANYYYNTFGTAVMGLAEISAKGSAQTNFYLTTTNGNIGQEGIWDCIGTELEVEFRGNTLTVVIEGVSISATPEDSRFTFYVSPGDLNSYLVLDNSTLGRLDYNKLGF